MNSEIWIAIITGLFSVAGVVISNKRSENRIHNEIVTHQAVTDTKLEELTREVRAHNNFAQRMPVVENDIKHINDEIHRLEEYHK